MKFLIQLSVLKSLIVHFMIKFSGIICIQIRGVTENLTWDNTMLAEYLSRGSVCPMFELETTPSDSLTAEERKQYLGFSHGLHISLESQCIFRVAGLNIISELLLERKCFSPKVTNTKLSCNA